MIRACARCRYGIKQTDPNGMAFISCGLLPPRAIEVGGQIAWTRPMMKLEGWCGQFRLSLLRLFNGARASR